jgi:GNAT superfamily N-acetyltransferase
MSSQSDSSAPKSVSEMKILARWEFAPDLQIVQVEAYPKENFKTLVDETLGSYHPFLQWQEALTDIEKEKYEALKAPLKGTYQLKLAAIHNEELIAICSSFQESTTTVMMGLSAIRTDFRGRGLYTALAKRVLELTKDAGFQAVASYHLMTNNPILIAKLKLGFNIFGFETHAVHGTLLKMVFHHNALMQKSLRYRAGELFLFSDEELYEFYGSPSANITSARP